MGRFILNGKFKLLILSIFLFTTLAYAQSVNKQIYVWDDFSGGLNVKGAPFDLLKKQGLTVPPENRNPQIIIKNEKEFAIA